MKRLLSIDFGEKRLGFAVSDPLRIAAHPLTTYRRRSKSEDIRFIGDLVSRYDVEKIIFGLPLNLDGTESRISLLCREFAEEIKATVPAAVEFFDERMTSGVVDKMLTDDADVSRQKRKSVRDKLSAVVILQDYLTNENRK